MEETPIQSEQPTKEGRGWLWVIIVIAVLIVLYFLLRGGKQPVEQQQPAGTQTPAETPEIQPKATPYTQGDAISDLEIGDNPDLPVDDFSTLEVAQEPVN